MMAMRKSSLFLLCGITAMFFFLVSCSHDDKDDGGDGVAPEQKGTRTVFMYMAVDNSLYPETTDVLNQLLSGVNKSGLNNCNFVLYLDNLGELPRLMTIQMGEKGKAEWKTVSSYKEHDSASPEVLNQIIKEVVYRFPADSYGLIVGSHGMGWIPIVDSYSAKMLSGAGYSLPDGIQQLDTSVPTRAFIQDRANWMDIDGFCNAVPNDLFDFIMFDACYMGSVEIAYALRDKTDYLVASPAEVLAEGFPYDILMEYLLMPQSDLEAVCEGYYNYFNEKSGVERSATVALIDCSQMEALAETVRDVFAESGTKGKIDNYLSVQRYDRLSARILFDLDDYLSKVGTSAYSRFVSQIEKTVLYKAATPAMLLGSSGFYINRYSGLSTYIWQDEYQNLNSVYSQLEWYKKVYNNQ